MQKFKSLLAAVEAELGDAGRLGSIDDTEQASGAGLLYDCLVCCAREYDLISICSDCRGAGQMYRNKIRRS